MSSITPAAGNPATSPKISTAGLFESEPLGVRGKLGDGGQHAPLIVAARILHRQHRQVGLEARGDQFGGDMCGGNPQAQQQANTNKAKLDTLITNAQNIGVPAATLQPILQQEKQLSASSAPFALFNDQSVADYYTNLAQRYSILAVQVQGLVTQSTQQLDYQASQTLQKLEAALAQRQSQNFVEAKTYSAQLTSYQNQLNKAQYPKDYLKINAGAQQSIQALQLMGPAYDSLTAFQQLIKQLKASHIDTTALNNEYQQDLLQFRGATSPADYSQLINLLNVQWQSTNDFSTQAIPYVGAAKLQEFSADIQQLKSYGMSTTSYQQKLTTDQQALRSTENDRRLPQGLGAD